MNKKKILVISDHPLSPSGVGSQTKYFIEALLKTNRYKFICLGGAMKHHNYDPIEVDGWGKDWIVIPIDGYGNHEVIRSVLQKEKPDLLWFMTDPRFYGWLWEIENEIRALVPMVYYHVWDNFPTPMFNKVWYDSTDEVVAISKVTDQIVKEASPESHGGYIPHAVNDNIFYKYTSSEEKEKVENLRKNIFSSTNNPDFKNTNKKIFFWNNRNARRKQSGTLIWWFKEWLDKVGHDKATLMMHTDARDPHGQDLPHIIEHLDVDDGQVLISTKKVSQEELAVMYNAADFTLNISDAEGFGLSTLESLSCGTPIIVNMTGGLQEQVTNGKEWFGWGIQPASKVVIGSLEVPYIYEDRISQQDFEKMLNKALKCSKKSYDKMSTAGIQHVKENYSFENFEKSWVNKIDEVIEKYGSWDTRNDYNKWILKEVA
jgi:glycosyltransferase involved in cell wall biosynthesis|tara:strand:+ start:1002 stop:2291 length:1290 start_codon:yes stop_codon:yes gene_type:complete